ncbi:hypothetical protein RS022_07820 [Candidatus Phytoplasma rubi]|uniref:Effector n=1 Tax=Candidatus Phytoplasma rubi TaxID=399025 RepID=A0ABY7BTG4_9MOLU|nr:hypothetical protein [Candidatus Phytoplasma rubi]WAN63603.1 hypothetical protein RS022_07820 [Candidatus Phytoplasma rubi]
MKKNKFFLKKINFIFLFTFLFLLRVSLINLKAINNDDELKKYYNESEESTKINDADEIKEKKYNSSSQPKIKVDSLFFKAIEKNKKISFDSLKQSNISFDVENEKIEINDLLKNKYKKDSKKKHVFLGWKYDLGSFLSKKIRLFYGIDNIRTVSCSSFQECLNFKQFIFGLLYHNIPKIDFLFDFLDISGFKEEFIDNKYDKIGLETVCFYSLLRKDPSLGYFYFKDEDIKDIHSVDISFCNCKISGYSLIDLIFEIINLKNEDLIIFKQHFNSYLKHLSKMDEEKISKQDIDVLHEEFLANIIDIDDMDILDKKFFLHLIKKVISIFVPKIFSLHCSVDHKNIKPLKEMNFELSLTKEHQTIGFLLKIEKNENNIFYLLFYEIFKDEKQNEENLRLIDKILILDLNTKEHLFFNHLTINIKQNKKIFFKKINLFRFDSMNLFS